MTDTERRDKEIGEGGKEEQMGAAMHRFTPQRLQPGSKARARTSVQYLPPEQLKPSYLAPPGLDVHQLEAGASTTLGTTGYMGC